MIKENRGPRCAAGRGHVGGWYAFGTLGVGHSAVQWAVVSARTAERGTGSGGVCLIELQQMSWRARELVKPDSSPRSLPLDLAVW